jgi:biopolymer transport protein ExbB
MDAFFGSEFLARGGLVVGVIGFGSFVALTVFLLRLFSLRRSKVLPRKLMVQVRDLVVREQVPDALTLCRMDDSPLARVYLAGLRQVGKPRAEIKEFVLEVGRHEAARMNAGLGVLETVAVVSPLLGLLGTVWGMIDVFRTIEVHGVGDAGALAGGIGTALYTTLAGLLVAIPVRVAHSYLLGRADRLVLEMEEAALELLDLLSRGDNAPEPDAERPPGPRAVNG